MMAFVSISFDFNDRKIPREQITVLVRQTVHGHPLKRFPPFEPPRKLLLPFFEICIFAARSRSINTLANTMPSAVAT